MTYDQPPMIDYSFFLRAECMWEIDACYRHIMAPAPRSSLERVAGVLERALARKEQA